MEAGWTKIETYNIRLETDLRTRSQRSRALAAQPSRLCIAMSTVKADIIAELQLLPTEAGGRLSSITAGEYRGVVGVGSEHFSVRWFIPADESLVPGGRTGTGDCGRCHYGRSSSSTRYREQAEICG